MTKRKAGVWQRAMYLTSKPDFIDDILAIREKFSLPTDGFSSDEAVEAWREKYIYYKPVSPEDDIEDGIDLAVARIITKPEYELSPGWHNSVKRFLLLNNVEDMQLPVSIGNQLVEDKMTKQLTIHIVVSEDTSKQDYIDEWENIERIRSMRQLKTPKQRRLAHPHILRRKKLAYETWVKTGSYEEASKAVIAKYPKEVEVKGYNSDSAKTDISNFIKQAGI
jgi:hypothetical protein